MTLSAATLSAGLQSLEPSSSEAVAITRLTDAWESYFLGAAVAGAALAGASITPGLAAFSGALVGMSAPGAGATSIAAAVTAFWAAQAGAATAMWITAPIVLVPPIVPPPPLPALASALVPVFASNTAGSLSLVASCDAIAAVLHSSGGVGALVLGSVPPSPPTPIPVL